MSNPPTLKPRREIESIIAQYALPELRHNHCDLIGLLHRNLAAEGQTECVFPMPFERSAGDPLHEAIQYWEAAWYMLTCLCGWSNASRGLDWFYRNNKNAQGDARLELLNTVWNSEGQLDVWALWMWESSGHQSPAAIIQEKFSAYPNYPWTSQKIQPDTGWKDAVERKYKPKEEQCVCLPYSFSCPGSTPLHLGHFFDLLPNDTQANNPTLLFDKPTHRATLVVDHFAGWYEALVEAGKALPPLGEHSWHVDVFAKPLGWLGTFRRSRDTGLWFQGKHSVHLAGQ